MFFEFNDGVLQISLSTIVDDSTRICLSVKKMEKIILEEEIIRRTDFFKLLGMLEAFADNIEDL